MHALYATSGTPLAPSRSSSFLPMLTRYRSLVSRLIVSAFCLGTLLPSFAQSGTGEISGRVVNAAGNYLNNVRVSVAGSTLATFTDSQGEYRLVNVPAGDVTVIVTFTGFPPQSATVKVAGNSARQDFTLTSEADRTVKLDAFTVSETILQGQAQAMNEKRFAPNIKDVVVMEGFPNVGEGDVGEYMKYVPGIVLQWNPQEPAQTSIRGMPNSGTILTINGVPMASTGTLGRSIDLATAATGNMERIEITKTPTPDMPANAVGGGVNVITKNGFGRTTPLLTYDVFATYTPLNGYHGPGPSLGKAANPDGQTSRSPIQPAFSLSYLRPVNDSLAFTFAFSGSSRQSEWLVLRPAWNYNTLGFTSYGMTDSPIENKKILANATVDYKLSASNRVQVAFQYSKQTNYLRQNSLTATYGAGSTNTRDTVQGAATGVGTVAQAFGWNNQYKPMQFITANFHHDDKAWKIAGLISYSKAGISLFDTEDGFFANAGTTNIPNLILRSEGIDAEPAQHQKVATLTATSRTGSPVDVYNGDLYSIGTVTSNNRWYHDRLGKAALDVTRNFEGAFSSSIKAGVSVDQRKQDVTSKPLTWTFTPPGGAAGKIAGNHNVIDSNYASDDQFTDVRGRGVRVRFISLRKLYDLYKVHPDWFVLNDVTAYTGEVNADTKITETVSAGYIRGDLRLLQNRLWLVGGVRFEKTEDEGRGPLNDLKATYVKDASGKLVLGANGNPIKINASALDLAKLQFTRLGARSNKNYSGYYPSMNSSFAITEHFTARAAYAKTIGRPDFSDITPTVAISDPITNPTQRIITASNTGLKPWSSDNYDVTLEAYGFKGAVASVSAFRKDLKNFFATSSAPATAAALAEFGLSSDYLDYTINTTRNAGSATITGIEASYRQSLRFLPSFFKNFQPYGSITSMHVSGPNAEDLTDFVPTTFTWGVNYASARFTANFTVNEFNYTRRNPIAPSATVAPNSYLWYDTKRTIDSSVEFRCHKNLSLYLSVRNLTGEGRRQGNWTASTPTYARNSIYQHTGALFSAGIRGRF